MLQYSPSKKRELDLKSYKDPSGLQSKIAQTPLEDYCFTGFESILDIGCGDGKITAQLAQHAAMGKVIGIDNSDSMIAYAKGSFSKKGYPNLRFEKRDACSFAFRSSFDLITSFSCLHWIKDQTLALQNIERHLKPHGHALIVTFPRTKSFWDPIEAVAHSPKWRGYFEEDLYPHCFLDEEQYKDLFSETNLKIQFIETTSHVIKFEGKAGFENYMKRWVPFLAFLPQQFHQEFLHEIGDKSLDFAPVQPDGYVYHSYEKIVIYAQKQYTSI